MTGNWQTSNTGQGGDIYAEADPADAFPADPSYSARQEPRPPLEILRGFMKARGISEQSILDYLKEEGRITDHIARLDEIPESVISGVVESWIEMMSPDVEDL